MKKQMHREIARPTIGLYGKLKGETGEGGTSWINIRGSFKVLHRWLLCEIWQVKSLDNSPSYIQEGTTKNLSGITKASSHSKLTGRVKTRREINISASSKWINTLHYNLIIRNNTTVIYSHLQHIFKKSSQFQIINWPTFVEDFPIVGLIQNLHTFVARNK